ncbi:MAG: ABC transporter substrate-binding protein [Bacteriovorax sp.]|jgi:ABC-type transporter MlaC component|nr:ABC transporter substrate-binding protein [Bacteriovorax sp.]
MKNIASLFTFIVLCALILTENVSAASPEELIKDIFLKTGKENLLLNAKTKAEVEAHIDFKEMAKTVLAEEYTKRSASDLKWFEVTLKEIITRSVYPSAPKFLENVKITYKKTKATDRDAKVSSSVSKKGESTDVDYLLKKVGDDWKVVDVAIDEESWVKTINEKVQKTIKEKGWSGLKDLLNKRLTELKTNKKS